MLDLPNDLTSLCMVFHVILLKSYVGDLTSILPLIEAELIHEVMEKV